MAGLELSAAFWGTTLRAEMAIVAVLLAPGDFSR